VGGETHKAATAPDPRSHVVHDADGSARIAGSRCTECGYPAAERLDRCPVCRATTQHAEFGPAGTVFAATVLRVPVPGRTPPYGLAYVDLDEGPRILAHVATDDRALFPFERVRLAGTTADGDPLVELAA
jgi:uncharacterized OB-fold protein